MERKTRTKIHDPWRVVHRWLLRRQLRDLADLDVEHMTETTEGRPMSDKMREEFEVAWRKNAGWWAWQASRESVVVELPVIKPGEWANTSMERAAMRDAIGMCKKRIEVAGLKVKP